jgi:hypothetical protein
MKKSLLFLILSLILIFPVCAYAVDTEVQDLTDITSPVAGDDMYIVDDPDGTPASKKINIGALLGVATDLDDGGAISANAVTLGTDTTGNYAATVADAGNSTITVANSGSETAAVTLDLTANGVDDTHIDWGTGANQVSATDVPMAVISGSTYSTVQDLQNIFHSSGYVSGGVITDAGGATVDIAAGTGLVRATNSSVAEILYFDWGAASGQTITADTTRFIGVEYNSGTPQFTIRTSDDFDNQTDFILGTVVNESGTLHIVNTPHAVGDHATNMILRTHETMGIQRDDKTAGLIIGETGTREITLSAGSLWDRLGEHAISAVDTSVTGGFDTYSSNGQEATAATAWPNTQYDNAGTLTTMTNNRWGVLWFYVELDDHLVMVYGTAEHVSAAAAATQLVPSVLPNRISDQGVLLARLIFQKSASTAEEIDSAFAKSFVGVAASDHGNLSGLVDDDHTQYLLADGTRDLAGAWFMANQALTGVNIDTGTLDGITTLQMPSGDIGATGARINKGWYTDLQVTNAIAGDVTGNAATVTTNANLTGVVTSTGNATAIADKALAIAKLADGTDGELLTWSASGVIETIGVGTSTYVLTSNGVGAPPTFQAAAGGTSLDTGTVAYADRSITVDTGGTIDVNLGTATGDDFTVDTNAFVVNGTNGYVGLGTNSPNHQFSNNGGSFANLDADTGFYWTGGAASKYAAGYRTGSNPGWAMGIKIGITDPDETDFYIHFLDDAGNVEGSISGKSGGGGVQLNDASDERLKENIVDTSKGLATINAIKVRDYNKKGLQTTVTGFIAQELKDVVPNAVYIPSDPSKMMSVASSELIPILIKAVQELDAKIKILESKP